VAAAAAGPAADPAAIALPTVTPAVAVAAAAVVAPVTTDGHLDMLSKSWGRFSPYHRYNVDQYPLSFVNKEGGKDTHLVHRREHPCAGVRPTDPHMTDMTQLLYEYVSRIILNL
jgi:hypothetical protein